MNNKIMICKIKLDGDCDHANCVRGKHHNFVNACYKDTHCMQGRNVKTKCVPDKSEQSYLNIRYEDRDD